MPLKMTESTTPLILIGPGENGGPLLGGELFGLARTEALILTSIESGFGANCAKTTEQENDNRTAMPVLNVQRRIDLISLLLHELA